MPRRPIRARRHTRTRNLRRRQLPHRTTTSQTRTLRPPIRQQTLEPIRQIHALIHLKHRQRRTQPQHPPQQPRISHQLILKILSRQPQIVIRRPKTIRSHLCNILQQILDAHDAIMHPIFITIHVGTVDKATRHWEAQRFGRQRQPQIIRIARIKKQPLPTRQAQHLSTPMKRAALHPACHQTILALILGRLGTHQRDSSFPLPHHRRQHRHITAPLSETGLGRQLRTNLRTQILIRQP